VFLKLVMRLPICVSFSWNRQNIQFIYITYAIDLNYLSADRTYVANSQQLNLLKINPLPIACCLEQANVRCSDVT